MLVDDRDLTLLDDDHDLYLSLQYIGGSLIQQNLLTQQTFDVFIKHLNKAYQQNKIDNVTNLMYTATWVGGKIKHHVFMLYILKLLFNTNNE